MKISNKDFEEVLKKNGNRSYCIYKGEFKKDKYISEKDGDYWINTDINGFENILYNMRESERRHIRYRDSDDMVKNLTERHNLLKKDLTEFMEDIHELHTKKVISLREEEMLLTKEISEEQNKTTIKKLLTMFSRKGIQLEKRLKNIKNEIIEYQFNEYTLFFDEPSVFEEKLSDVNNFSHFLSFVNKTAIIKIIKKDMPYYESKIRFIQDNFINLMFEDISINKKDDIDKYIRDNIKELDGINGLNYEKVIDYNKKNNNSILVIKETRDEENQTIKYRVYANENFISIKKQSNMRDDIISPMRYFLQDNQEDYENLNIKEIDRGNKQRDFVFNEKKKKKSDSMDMTDAEDSDMYSMIKSPSKKAGSFRDEFQDYAVEELEFNIPIHKEKDIKKLLEAVNDILTECSYGVYDYITEHKSSYFQSKSSSKEYNMLKIFLREKLLQNDLKSIGDKKLTRSKKI